MTQGEIDLIGLGWDAILVALVGVVENMEMILVLKWNPKPFVGTGLILTRSITYFIVDERLIVENLGPKMLISHGCSWEVDDWVLVVGDPDWVGDSILKEVGEGLVADSGLLERHEVLHWGYGALDVECSESGMSPTHAMPSDPDRSLVFVMELLDSCQDLLLKTHVGMVEATVNITFMASSAVIGVLCVPEGYVLDRVFCVVGASECHSDHMVHRVIGGKALGPF